MADARKLWTAGSTAPAEIPVADVVARAEAFRRKVRLSHALEYAAGALVVGFFVAAAAIPEVARLPPISRVGAALIACGSVFVMTYLALRGTPTEVRRDGATLGCYRAELVRRRDLLASVTLWYQAPFWPGTVVLVVGVAIDRWDAPGAAGSLATVVAVIVATSLGIGLVNRRAAAKLSREIEALPVEVRGAGPS